MNCLFALMQRPVVCVLALLGGDALVPTVCPANELCCPPFPLPRDLEVGDRWTYLSSASSSYTGTIETELDTITISVDARHELSGQTYFELSDGGLYRVDAELRTWKYDAATGGEILYWDISTLWTELVSIPEDSLENWLNENQDQHHGIYLLINRARIQLVSAILQCSGCLGVSLHKISWGV